MVRNVGPLGEGNFEGVVLKTSVNDGPLDIANKAIATLDTLAMLIEGPAAGLAITAISRWEATDAQPEVDFGSEASILGFDLLNAFFIIGDGVTGVAGPLPQAIGPFVIPAGAVGVGFEDLLIQSFVPSPVAAQGWAVSNTVRHSSL